MLSDVAARFGDYSCRVVDRILLIAGAPGTGKTTLVCQVKAGRVVARKSVSRFVPANAAATVFFTRFMSFTKRLDSHDHCVTFRAFGTHLEVHMIVHFIRNGYGQDEWESNPYYNDQDSAGPLANTEWRKEGPMTSVVLGLLGFIPCDNQVLVRMRSLTYLSSSRLSSMASRTPPAGPLGGVFAPPNMGTPWIPSNQSTRSAVRQLKRQILWRALAVFTTTYVAADQIIKPFTKIAEEYAGDEIGCTTVPKYSWPGGMVALSSSPTTCTTLSANEKVPNGVPVNPLYLQHMRSALRHFISMRLPVMVLREQIRICPGLIDLSMTLFYKYWQLVYAPTNTLDAHPLGAARETWACGDLKLPASAPGMVLPVFVNCPNTSVNFTDVSMSRENPGMSEISIIILKRLIRSLASTLVTSQSPRFTRPNG